MPDTIQPSQSSSALKRVFRSSVSSPSFWVAIFFSSLTLFSLIVSFGKLDLGGFPFLVLQQYLKFRDWVFSPLVLILPFALPDIAKDVIIAYLFLGFTNLRADQISRSVFDPKDKTEGGHWIKLVLLWPRTLRAHLWNLKVANFFRHKVVSDDDGNDRVSVELNVMLTHGKLYPVLLGIEAALAVLASAWGSIS